MADLWHQFGSDLLLGPTGDLATADGTTLTQQRVLRRLLTNLGDYIWQLSYGAGLAWFVGQPASVASIGGVIRAQMLREATVARTPEPTVAVQAGATGEVYVTVSYADAASGATQVLSFQLGES
jgi:hypothetical protein